jgi:uncharacterized YigZ family protein
MSDTYRTIEASAEANLQVEGSRFLSVSIPVTSREQVDTAVASVRDREPTATHHCTAYRLGHDGDDFRYNDDGEPSGTAGPPILRQIDARELTQTLVVVTRYFGGTKLGTGGLVRAYGEAASRALEHASVVEKVVRVPVRVAFGYDDTAAANQLLHHFDAVVRARDYTDVTEWLVAVRRSQLDTFLEGFTNALANRGTIVNVEGTRGGE